MSEPPFRPSSHNILSSQITGQEADPLLVIWVSVTVGEFADAVGETRIKNKTSAVDDKISEYNPLLVFIFLLRYLPFIFHMKNVNIPAYLHN
jgi:hypothetical protein